MRRDNYLSTIPAKITIIRRHHPLEGQQLDVRSAGGSTVVVRLTDGSSLKIPRHWTDADGLERTEFSGDSPFTVYGLRELLRLFMSLRKRHRGAVSEGHEKIESPHDGAGRVDVQAKTIGVHRRGAARRAPDSWSNRLALSRMISIFSDNFFLTQSVALAPQRGGFVIQMPYGAFQVAHPPMIFRHQRWHKALRAEPRTHTARSAREKRPGAVSSTPVGMGNVAARF